MSYIFLFLPIFASLTKHHTVNEAMRTKYNTGLTKIAVTSTLFMVFTLHVYQFHILQIKVLASGLTIIRAMNRSLSTMPTLAVTSSLKMYVIV